MHHDSCTCRTHTPGKLPPHIAKGLQVLRGRIDPEGKPLPSSKLDETLNLATWNVREFGRSPREDASIHYIAEVLGKFDLIALIELRDDLHDLDRVLPILGPYWRVLYSDANADDPGNDERIAFLYDSRAVTPTGLAAEVDPFRAKGADGQWRSTMEYWRSPYMASFRAGDFDFVLVGVHARWDAGGGGEKSRILELEALANWVDAKVRSKACEDHDVILLGDFNTPKRSGKLYEALTAKGLRVPLSLKDAKTNLSRTASFDQILHYSEFTKMDADAGGVVDFTGDWRELYPAAHFKGMKESDFSYQMSDHLPMWVQLDVDTDGETLEQLAAPPKVAKVTVKPKPGT